MAGGRARRSNAVAMHATQNGLAFHFVLGTVRGDEIVGQPRHEGLRGVAAARLGHGCKKRRQSPPVLLQKASTAAKTSAFSARTPRRTTPPKVARRRGICCARLRAHAMHYIGIGVIQTRLRTSRRPRPYTGAADKNPLGTFCRGRAAPSRGRGAVSLGPYGPSPAEGRPRLVLASQPGRGVVGHLPQRAE